MLDVSFCITTIGRLTYRMHVNERVTVLNICWTCVTYLNVWRSRFVPLAVLSPKYIASNLPVKLQDIIIICFLSQFNFYLPLSHMAQVWNSAQLCMERLLVYVNCSRNVLQAWYTISLSSDKPFHFFIFNSSNHIPLK